MQEIRIGTRTSKLAMAQAAAVAASLRALHPELTTKIIGFDAASDGSDEKIEEADFTTVLHEAVQDAEIDIAVHSFKDIRTSASPMMGMILLTTRENPRDVAVFRSDILETLRHGKTVVLGTSTDLRTLNATEFLAKALPQSGGRTAKIETKPLRGAVESRLRQLEDGAFDGIILAATGLNRLSQDEEVTALLADKKFMILPLSECPTAPGQGALALEYRETDLPTYQIIAPVYDSPTFEHVMRELHVLKQHRGTMGATDIAAKHIADHITFIKGVDENGNAVKTIDWTAPVTPITVQGNLWDGADIREQTSRTENLPLRDEITGQAVFIAHSRAAVPETLVSLQEKTLWTSGVNSWFRLAAQGLWVQGCTEELGHSVLADALTRLPFLRLPAFGSWSVLTHDRSRNDWQDAQVVATYTVKNGFDPQAAETLKTAKHIFWSSASQYDAYRDYAPHDAFHYCRAGKTAQELKAHNLQTLIVFPNHETWRQCLTSA